MALNVITEPTILAVSVSDFKDYAKITHDYEDTLIESLIKSTEIYFTHVTNYALGLTQYQFNIDEFPQNKNFIKLPIAPVVNTEDNSVEITYLDADNQSQTYDSSSYSVDTLSKPGKIYIQSSNDWPNTYNSYNAVTIKFYAGYDDADNIPHLIKNWIMQRVTKLYSNREGLASNNLISLPREFIDGLIDPYRVFYFTN